MFLPYISQIFYNQNRPQYVLEELIKLNIFVVVAGPISILKVLIYIVNV